MKNMKLSEKLNAKNAMRVVALLLALMMLFSTIGCKDEKKPKSDPTTSSTTSDTSSDTPSDTSSDDVSSEDVSSDDNTSTQGNTSKTQATVDPLKGDINVAFEYGSSGERADKDEFTPTKDIAGLSYGYKGYVEKERNKRLDEILNTKNTENYYEITGKKYYVSTAGSDTNDGSSPKKAIQSLNAVESLDVKPGDAVLFERGGIWRLTECLECRSGVTYGSYGKGAKPMFLGSGKNFAQEVWKPSNKRNVWQIIYMYGYPAGVFFNEGAEIGYQKLGLRDMKKNTDFFYNEENSTLYIYCDKGNPAKHWDFIEVSQTGIGVKIQNYAKNTVVDNFAVRYTGTHGVFCSYNAVNMTVTNCEIGYNGGAWVGGRPTGGNARYGNSIESWCGATGYNTSHNWIYQNFDTATSPQGKTGPATGHASNQKISDNLFEYNNCDIESWEGAGIVYTNCKYDNNIHRFTSLGWGTRPDDGGIRGIDGVHFGGWSAGQIASVSWSNNIIDCPGRAIFKLGVASYADYKHFVRKGNVYYIKQSMRTTPQLISRAMVWLDENTQTGNYDAKTEVDTIKAFKEFEPGAKVHWYK